MQAEADARGRRRHRGRGPPGPPEPRPPVPLDRYPEIARAHHGSLAHEERQVVEELLKSGQLPCLVATSSLELGIDMGAVDLVIQVESPKSVARGIQRIGRAGHELGAVSKGRIFPKFRSDLLECAVVAKQMRAGEIEETVIPRNPLDVLAQHIVSMVADGEWDVDEIERHRHRRPSPTRSSAASSSRTCSTCSTAATRPSASPSCARASSGTGPRARSAAARAPASSPSPTPARSPTAASTASTCPTAAGSASSTRRWSTRRAPARSSCSAPRTWRIEEITRDRVIVTPGARRPRGGAVLARRRRRPPGRARPRDRRVLARGGLRRARRPRPRLRPRRSSPPRTSSPTCASSRRRPASCPPTRRSSIERFRDEIGDWRLCVLSPVRRPRPRRLGPGARRPDPQRVRARGRRDLVRRRDRRPPARRRRGALARPRHCSSADEVEDLIVGELSGSALFGARFREAAGRSLLIPRAYPGKRTPLWQQRLKSQSLLEVAKDFPRFPVTLETYREVLRDVLDLPALGEILRDLRSRRITLVEVETAERLAVRLLAALRLRRDLHVRGRHAQRRAPRGGARPRPRPAARAARPGGAARADRPRRRSTTSRTRSSTAPSRRARSTATSSSRSSAASATSATTRCAERVAEGYSAASMLAKLDDERRAVKVRIAGEERWIAAEDGGLYRDALGVPVPSGLPDAFLETVEDPMAVADAPLRAHPRPVPDRAGPSPLRRRPDPGAEGARGGSELVRGELLPGGTEREWCDPDVLRRLRRASLAVLRKEVEAADTARARPLPPLLAERRRLPPRRRRPRPPARGAGAAAGRGADARDLGARRAAAPPRRLLAGLARPALDRRRDRLDRRRARSAAPAASPSTSARTSGSPARRRRTPSSTAPRARSTTRSASCSRSGPAFWIDLVADLDCPDARSSTPRSGTSPGRAR